MTVYDLDDLIQMYIEETLPEGEKIFRYRDSHGLEKWIHLDELKIQSGFKKIYPSEKYIERFSGIINRQHGSES